jgi:integral membrane protein (TIGR00529 family)
MLSPSPALLISIAAILILVRLKVPVAFGILAGCVLLIALAIPGHDVPSLLWKTVKDKQTWQLFIILPSTMAFSRLMEKKGLLTRLAAALEAVGSKLAVHLLPAVIGLVPMPAGALVAATAVTGLAEKLKLAPERIAFINYWFRHIWEFSMPMYSTIIIASTVLGIPMSTMVRTLLPLTGLAVLLGAIASYRMLRNAPHEERPARKPVNGIFFSLFRAAWPIMLLIALILARVEAWIAFPVTLILLIVQQRVNRGEMKDALKYAFNPMILLLLAAVMLYQMTARNSDAAGALIANMQSLGLPPLLMLIGMPLLIGLAIGYGPAISGIALPLLLPYIVNGSGIHTNALFVACLSGIAGQLLSPAHLCFCLSVEYFKTTLGKIYQYTIPILLVMELIAVGVYLFFR